MRLNTVFFLILVSILFSACYPYDNNAYNNGYGYSNDRYRYDNYDYRYDRREERLRRERERLEDERERLERERRESQKHSGRPVVERPAVVVDKCPRGFFPRGSKCSKQERKRGCQDTRSSTGARYCVRGV